MPEKFEGGTPPQEKGEKIQTPEVSQQLSFVKEAAWQYKDLPSAKVEQSFKDAFEKLPEEERKAISLELQALGVEIGTLDKQNEGVAIVRQDEIVNRFREVLDRSGVVASAKEGGVERVREQYSGLVGEAAAYLQEYESFAQSVKDKSDDTKQNAKYLLAVVSGIRAELERLQLADIQSVQPKGELAKERSARMLVFTTIGQLGQRLEPNIELEGLIGFSTLDKLIKKFHSAKKYLEESVLESEAEEE
ncbi:hypothetical protein HY798_02760 [Candidatus Falkowbacteria bacterium]|nr:hypothetical protein [Candidatus Falkowbacteria bacterium]